jgi:hypothetical protein
MAKSSRVPPRPLKGSIPHAVQLALQARLERHVYAHWKDRCGEIVVRYRGAFAYVDAFPLRHQFMPGTTPEEQVRVEATPTHLCRLGYMGGPMFGPSPSSNTVARSTSPLSSRRARPWGLPRRPSTARQWCICRIELARYPTNRWREGGAWGELRGELGLSVGTAWRCVSPARREPTGRGPQGKSRDRKILASSRKTRHATPYGFRVAACKSDARTNTWMNARARRLASHSFCFASNFS